MRVFRPAEPHTPFPAAGDGPIPRSRTASDCRSAAPRRAAAGFQTRTEVAAVRSLLDARVRPLPPESVPLPEAAGRVLAADVTAAVAVPAFDRAAMDGYALHGEETFGCDAYNPLEFAILGEAFPARPFAGAVRPGEAVA